MKHLKNKFSWKLELPNKPEEKKKTAIKNRPKTKSHLIQKVNSDPDFSIICEMKLVYKTPYTTLTLIQRKKRRSSSKNAFLIVFEYIDFVEFSKHIQGRERKQP